jgi:hypothetical protein
VLFASLVKSEKVGILHDQNSLMVTAELQMLAVG